MCKRTVKLIREDGQALPILARRCDSFACRLRGLAFRRQIGDEEGLLFVEPAESRLGTSIHMFFVFFAIGVVWLDKDGAVVDTVVAQPFRPYYAPRAPAQYFLEGPPALVEWVRVGERLRMESVDGASDTVS